VRPGRDWKGRQERDGNEGSPDEAKRRMNAKRGVRFGVEMTAIRSEARVVGKDRVCVCCGRQMLWPEERRFCRLGQANGQRLDLESNGWTKRAECRSCTSTTIRILVVQPNFSHRWDGQDIECSGQTVNAAKSDSRPISAAGTHSNSGPHALQSVP